MLSLVNLHFYATRKSFSVTKFLTQWYRKQMRLKLFSFSTLLSIGDVASWSKGIGSVSLLWGWLWTELDYPLVSPSRSALFSKHWKQRKSSRRENDIWEVFLFPEGQRHQCCALGFTYFHKWRFPIHRTTGPRACDVKDVIWWVVVRIMWFFIRSLCDLSVGIQKYCIK